MSQKTRKYILTAIFVLFFSLTPSQIKAATTFNLLPKCDVTVYEVEQNGTITEDICKGSKGGCVYPADYKEGPSENGAILRVLSYRACGFDDFLQLFINGFQLGLGVLGLVVLFFFIWGGFGFIIAAGRAEKIQEAKNTLKGAFIGMIIVMTSWVFVNFYVFAFSQDPKNNPEGKLFYRENGSFFWWGKSCHETETYQETCNKYNLHEGCGGEKNSLTDKNIRQLQQKLNELGCECGPVSGCFIPRTKDCVVKFQTKNAIVNSPDPDLGDPLAPETKYGIVDANTWEAAFYGSYSCK